MKPDDDAVESIAVCGEVESTGWAERAVAEMQPAWCYATLALLAILERQIMPPVRLK